MKKIISVFLLLSQITLCAQNKTTLTISVAKQPKAQLTSFDDNQINRLESQIIKGVTQNGVAAYNVKNNVVLVPQLNITNNQTINPGVQTINVIDAELSMITKIADGSVVFDTYIKKIQGSGRTNELALNNLISNINLNENASFGDFLKNSEKKVIDYYNSNCNNIKNQANRLISTNQFEEAMMLLVSIPSQTTCFTQTNALLESTFVKYQNKNCQKWLQSAKARLALNDYENGFQLLSQIDPLSQCSKEVKDILNKESKEIDHQRDKNRYWDYLKMVYSTNLEIARYRYDSINNLLLLFANRNPYYYY